MSRSTILLPDQSLLDAEELAIAGATVKRQTVEACPPRVIITGTLTRPADTIAYAAGDTLANSISAPVAITFAGAARYNGGGGRLLGATLLDRANQTVKLDSELWLFNSAAAPPSQNDNASFDPLHVTLPDLFAIVRFSNAAGNFFIGAPGAGSGGNVIFVGLQISTPNFAIPYKCGPATTSLWGLAVVRNAYTPISAETFQYRLHLDQE
jgi:hypothetical protein